MEYKLKHQVLTIYWMVLLLHCVFQYYELWLRAITKPLLLPLLLIYLIQDDAYIGRPIGKFIFYIGMFLAFFGDVLLILINDTFFLSGMIAFMLMNLCYTFCFVTLHSLRFRSLLPIMGTILLLFILENRFMDFLGNRLGNYRIPIMVYMISLSLMICAAVNMAGNPGIRKTALRFFIPGTVIFLLENALLAFNLFHFNRNKDLFIAVMLSYGLAQLLIVKGIHKVFLRNSASPVMT